MEFTKKEIKGIKEYLKVCVNGRMDSLTFIHNGEDYSLSYEFSGLGEVSVCIAKYDYENEDEGLNILFDERFSYSLYDENDEKKTDDEIDDEPMYDDDDMRGNNMRKNLGQWDSAYDDNGHFNNGFRYSDWN